MKNKYPIILLLLALFSVSSCIQPEAPNAECDIISVDTTNSWFKNNKEILTGEFKINNENIIFILKDEANFDSIEISHDSIIKAFALTPGARIEKKNIEIDKNGIFLYFTTHSEDGLWSKNYVIKFIKMPHLEIGKPFSFENVETNIFSVWYEVNDDGIRSDIWSSGNEGFKSSGVAESPEDYPTTSYDYGFDGKCIKLETCSTGNWGIKAKKPIAAGNIFIGDFISNKALLQPLQATRFGKQILPENAKPIALTGHYKYTPGAIVTNKNNEAMEAKRDTCDIYAVLYEVDPDKFVPLDGSNIKSSDRIVLIADMQNPEEPTEWTKFEFPFETRNGKVFDYERLNNNGYAIAVVASSSKGGASFVGAVGSTLLIDEIKIEWEEK